jgi:hypothetical protein
LKSEQAALLPDFEATFAGTVEIPDPQSGPVRDYYSLTQHLIQHPETTPEERLVLEDRRNQTIRLLFYPTIARRFQEANAVRIDESYSSLGLTPPDFKTLTRAQAIEAAKTFQAALDAATPKPPPPPPVVEGAPAPPAPPEPVSTAPVEALELGPILKDFIDLKRNVIPDTWV